MVSFSFCDDKGTSPRRWMVPCRVQLVRLAHLSAMEAQEGKQAFIAQNYVSECSHYTMWSLQWSEALGARSVSFHWLLGLMTTPHSVQSIASLSQSKRKGWGIGLDSHWWCWDICCPVKWDIFKGCIWHWNNVPYFKGEVKKKKPAFAEYL